MTERTAAEIIFAQCEVDVAEAKAHVFKEFIESGLPVENSTLDALEDLANKVTRRWWIAKMVKRPNPPVDTNDLLERMTHRTNALVALTQAIINRSGMIDPNSLQVSILGMSADINAVWGALIEAGLMTPANRQDYMDAAVGELYRRGMDECQKIVIASSGGKPS